MNIDREVDHVIEVDVMYDMFTAIVHVGGGRARVSLATPLCTPITPWWVSGDCAFRDDKVCVIMHIAGDGMTNDKHIDVFH